MTHIAFPYHFDRRGRTAEADDNTHLRDLIESVLFTSPGERVNQPTFGSGISHLVFAPNSFELAATTQLLVQSALQQWLGSLIQVEAVQVEVIESSFVVTIQFTSRADQQQQVAQFTRGGALP